MFLDALFGRGQRDRDSADATGLEFIDDFVSALDGACDGFDRIKFDSVEDWDATITTTDGEQLVHRFWEHGYAPSDEAILYLTRTLCERYSAVMDTDGYDISSAPHRANWVYTIVTVYTNRRLAEYEHRKAARRPVRRV